MAISGARNRSCSTCSAMPSSLPIRAKSPCDAGGENDWLVTSIRDTGIGIDPQQHQSIFEPFRQADSGLARKHEGTGLGLSICKRLVERLGGSISVESVPGQGSTFTVQLPLELDKSRE